MLVKSTPTTSPDATRRLPLIHTRDCWLSVALHHYHPRAYFPTTPLPLAPALAPTGDEGGAEDRRQTMDPEDAQVSRHLEVDI